MSDVEKMAAMRLSKMTDNKDAKPIDLLRAAIHDIETGALQCDGMMLVWMVRPKDSDWDYGVYRANVTRIEELAWYRLLEHSHLHKWIRR